MTEDLIKITEVEKFPGMVADTRKAREFVAMSLTQVDNDRDLVIQTRAMEELLEQTWLSIESHPITGAKLNQEVEQRATVRKQDADNMGKPISWDQARKPFRWTPPTVILNIDEAPDREGIKTRAEQVKTILLVLDTVVGK